MALKVFCSDCVLNSFSSLLSTSYPFHFFNKFCEKVYILTFTHFCTKLIKTVSYTVTIRLQIVVFFKDHVTLFLF